MSSKRLFAVGLAFACADAIACAGAPAPKPPAPPTASSPAKAAPQSGALFASVRDALLPIGCYDAGKRAWGAGAACTSLVPKGARVALEAGAPRAIVGDEAPDLGCDLGPLLRTDGPSMGYAAWPLDLRATVRLEPPRRGLERPPPLSAEDGAKIAAQLKGPDAPGVEPLEGSVVATLDLDGDGKDDRVLVVHLAPAAPHARFGFVGALFVARSAAGRVDLVTAEEGAELELRGTLDVDRDGVRELWWRASVCEDDGPSETLSEGLAHLASDRVERVGEVVVGGQGTCASDWLESP